MDTKESLQKRLNEINAEIAKLREEALKIIGKFELLSDIEKENKKK